MLRRLGSLAVLTVTAAGLAACETGNAPLEDGYVPAQEDYYDEEAYGQPTLPDTWEGGDVPPDFRYGTTEVPDENIGRGDRANPDTLYDGTVDTDSDPVLGPFEEDLFD